jgi:sugar/nucleoside kinase (ribokinase family)
MSSRKGVVVCGVAVAAAAVGWMVWRRRRKDESDDACVISIVGDTYTDIMVGPVESLPTWGQDRLAERPIQLLPGGSSLNTCVQLTNLIASNLFFQNVFQKLPLCFSQCATKVFSSIGADTLGDFIKSKMNELGVDLRAKVHPSLSTAACVVLSGASDRCFVSHRGSIGAFNLQDLDLDEVLTAHHAHVAGFYNCHSLRTGVAEIFKRAKAKGLTTSFNTQYDASEKWDGIDEILPFVDVFLLNQTEMQKICKTESIEEATRYLVCRGVKIVIVTRGPHGAMAFDSSTGVYIEQACKQIPKVVDTTGAGDAFNAGFLIAWKCTNDLQEGLRWGCALGTSMVQVFGASTKLSQELIQSSLIERVK